jgi:hypothetical protein
MDDDGMTVTDTSRRTGSAIGNSDPIGTDPCDAARGDDNGNEDDDGIATRAAAGEAADGDDNDDNGVGVATAAAVPFRSAFHHACRCWSRRSRMVVNIRSSSYVGCNNVESDDDDPDGDDADKDDEDRRGNDGDGCVRMLLTNVSNSVTL